MSGILAFLPKNRMLLGGIVLLVVLAAYYIYSRGSSKTREPFQTTAAPVTTSTNPTAAFAAAVTIPATPPPDLVNNPDVCNMLKNMLNVTTAQMNNDLVKMNPGQLKLIQTSHDSIVKQIADLKC